MDEYRPAPSPDNYDQIITNMNATGASGRFSDMMNTIGDAMQREFDSIDDGLGPPTKQKFTVREVSELTGLKMHAIRNRINQGEIKASNASGSMWFIPREEVKKLMPDSGGDDQSEPAGI